MKLSSPVKFGCWVPLAALGILFIGISIYDKVTPSAAKKALPESASEIQEHYHEAGFMAQDFMRCLKAKVPRQEVEEYANRLNLPHPYAKGRKIESIAGLDAGLGLAPSWFDAPMADDAEVVYYDAGQSWVAVLKYRQPYMYFMVFNW